uniref:Copper transport protein ATOX1 n=1 Tax=Anthurium amnicola TaxID=1678845 RepID=A0A1D1ZHU7_9ARAE
MRTGRMHGFMCQSQASTAVCIPGDTRSVIVPRRPDRTLVDHPRAPADFKYSRLVDSRRRRPAPPPEKRLQLITLPVREGGEKRLQVMAVPTKPKAAVTAMAAAKTVKGVCRVDLARPGNAPPPPPPSDNLAFQVVVMRVSIHCQGCAGKVKKLISKMEGVTSFSIDLEAKRVTVMGHVSPTGVLESISKVKKAEFWPSSAPAKANPKAEPASFSHSQNVTSSIPPLQVCVVGGKTLDISQ